MFECEICGRSQEKLVAWNHRSSDVVVLLCDVCDQESIGPDFGWDRLFEVNRGGQLPVGVTNRDEATKALLPVILKPIREHLLSKFEDDGIEIEIEWDQVPDGHSMCDGCWRKKNAVDPTKQREQISPRVKCCWCGQMNFSGLFLQQGPKKCVAEHGLAPIPEIE